MGGNHGGRVNDSVPSPLCTVPVFLGNPHGGQAKGGLLGFLSRHLLGNTTGVNAQEPAHLDAATSSSDPLYLEAVLAGVQADIVCYADAGNNEAHVQGHFPADQLDTLQQLGTLLLVHQGNQGISQLQGQRIWWLDRTGICHGTSCLWRTSLFSHLPLDFSHLLHRLELVAQEAQGSPQRNQHIPGKAGENTDESHGSTSHIVNPGALGELSAHIDAEGLVGGGASDYDTGSEGHQQGRQLGQKSVTDGKGGVGLDGSTEGLSPQHHSEDESHHKVYDGDENTHLHVSRDKLGGTVHGTVEVRLPLHVHLALACLLLGNGTSIVLGLHGGLLHGHGIQGKAGGNLGNTGGTLGDDKGLDGNQNDEDDKTDEQSLIAGGTHHKAGKGLDHLAIEFQTLRKDEAGG